MAQAIPMTMADIAEGFQVVALVMFIVIIPHSVACLLAYERHPAIQYASHHKDSGYWWSLMTWSWYVRISALGLLVLFSLYFIRVFNHYDAVVQHLQPQPDWSYFLSMAMTCIFLAILWLPSIFYLYIKHAVRHDPRIRRLVNEETTRCKDC